MVFTKAHIQQIFSNHFDQTGFNNVLKIHQGAMSYVYEVISKGYSYILKVYPPSRQYVAGKEYEIIKKIEKLAVKTPKINYVGRYNNFSYIIYEKIPGKTLQFNLLSNENKDIIARQIVQNLKRFLEVSYKSFGSLTEEEPTYPSWESFLTENINRGLVDLKKVDWNIKLDISKIERYLMDFAGSYTGAANGLVWSDFNQGNIIVLDNQLSGIVDFEGCFYGDPLLCLGYLFAKEGNSGFFKHIKNQMQTFLEIKDNYIYFYALLRLLRISKYLGEPFPNGQPRKPVFNYFKGIKEALKSV